MNLGRRAGRGDTHDIGRYIVVALLDADGRRADAARGPGVVRALLLSGARSPHPGAHRAAGLPPAGPNA